MSFLGSILKGPSASPLVAASGAAPDASKWTPDTLEWGIAHNLAETQSGGAWKEVGAVAVISEMAAKLREKGATNYDALNAQFKTSPDFFRRYKMQGSGLGSVFSTLTKTFGQMFPGEGATRFNFAKGDDGNLKFTTTGYSTNDKKDILTGLSLAAFPFAVGAVAAGASSIAAGTATVGSTLATAKGAVSVASTLNSLANDTSPSPSFNLPGGTGGVAGGGPAGAAGAAGVPAAAAAAGSTPGVPGPSAGADVPGAQAPRIIAEKTSQSWLIPAALALAFILAGFAVKGKK